jgi:hypothetical protein
MLFRALEKLKIIGHIKVHTEQQVVPDAGDLFSADVLHYFPSYCYKLVKDEYSNTPRDLDAIEQIEKILNSKLKWII